MDRDEEDQAADDEVAIAAALYAAAESVRARSGEPAAAIVELIDGAPDRVVLHVGSCDHVVSRSFVERMVRSAAMWLAAGDERKVA